MQCLITVMIATEKVTVICKLLTDGWTDVNLKSYVSPYFKKATLAATSKCDKPNKIL